MPAAVHPYFDGPSGGPGTWSIEKEIRADVKNYQGGFAGLFYGQRPSGVTRQMKDQKKAYIYAGATVVFWSTVASAFKISLRHMDFLQLLLYASLTSSAVLFVILYIREKHSLLASCSRKDYLRSAVLGFLNPFLYYMVLFRAYSLLPAQEAQPLNYTWPIMLVILSAPLLGQKLRARSLLAITTSFTGVVIISTRGDLASFRVTNPIGVSLALGSSIIWAIYWIYNIKDSLDEIARLFLNFAFGSFYIILLFLFSQRPFIVDPAGLAGAVYVGFFEMGITFFAWLMALRLSRTTSEVSNLAYLSPFISLFFIRQLVGERILLSTIAGLILIVTGIIIQQSKDGNPTF